MPQGRARKEVAFVLRDRYWALWLKGQSGLSFAALERRLCPHLKVTAREDGEGSRQPFALSKVATGKRGLGSSPTVPAIVEEADLTWPGSVRIYRALCFRSLASSLPDRPSEANLIRRGGEPVVATLRGDKSWGALEDADWIRTQGGGVLLEVSGAAIIAARTAAGRNVRLRSHCAAIVRACIDQLVLTDAAFAAIAEDFVELVSDWLPAVSDLRAYEEILFIPREGILYVAHPWIEQMEKERQRRREARASRPSAMNTGKGRCSTAAWRQTRSR